MQYDFISSYLLILVTYNKINRGDTGKVAMGIPMPGSCYSEEDFLKHYKEDSCSHMIKSLITDRVVASSIAEIVNVEKINGIFVHSKEYVNEENLLRYLSNTGVSDE